MNNKRLSFGHYKRSKAPFFPSWSTQVSNSETTCLETLQSVYNLDPCIIPVELTSNDSSFYIILDQKEINEEYIGMILKILAKSLTSKISCESSLELLRNTLSRPNFLTSLMSFISKGELENDKIHEYFSLIHAIISQFSKNAPIEASNLVCDIIYQCLAIVYSHNLPEYEAIKGMLTNVEIELDAIKSGLPINVCEKEHSFRHQEIIPSCFSINSTKTSTLQPALARGAYENTEHYLDVQFNLLKEDYVKPLREGVQNFRRGLSTNKDVRVYKSVYLNHSSLDGNNMVYYLKLCLPNILRSVESKRLMYGNILCISSDGFKTMLMATVKTKEKLNRSLLGVSIETEPFTLEYHVAYCVIESKAYFISYMHTLKALKEFTTLPFEDYIVRCNETNAPPEYLKESNTTPEISLPSCSEVSIKSVRVNDTSAGTTLPKLDSSLDHLPSHLDVSQARAIKAALTRQLAIIQGPPGTGKTFLGLEITRILHTRIDITFPILVLSYTNHALDQFLEGVSSFTKKIVRVGSRSNSEHMWPFNLKKNIRNQCFPRYSFESKYQEISMELEQLKGRLSYLSACLLTLRKKGILSSSSLHNDEYSVIADSMSKQLPSSMAAFLTKCTRSHSQFRRLSIPTLQKKIVQLVHPPEMVDPPEMTPQLPNPLTDDARPDAEEEYHRILDDEFFQISSTQAKFSQPTTAPLPKLQLEVTPSNIHEFPQSRILRNIMEMITSVPVNERQCEALELFNVSQLSAIHRMNLYCYWRKKLEGKISREHERCKVAFFKTRTKLVELQNLKALLVMKKAKVVGMTTSGAAQYCKVLHDLAPSVGRKVKMCERDIGAGIGARREHIPPEVSFSIAAHGTVYISAVIVEEAAEILEAHVIASLSPNCQHLIMIGDHQQLRPKVNDFDLAKHYNLDLSLFERLIQNGIKYEVLDYQHRMRPAFSRLLVPLIYKHLKDHPSVHEFPKIKGIAKNLFFLNHKRLEDSMGPNMDSFKNVFEAEFVLALCCYLLLQGYTTDDITIITPYSGQFLCLKKLQNDPSFCKCRGVRISILDNYQGEESNIILLSFVRSNNEDRVGFLRAENRICVALSRAKHGMYIFGNMSQLCKASPIWQHINTRLFEHDYIGQQLPLECCNHPEEKMMVASGLELLKNFPEACCGRRPCSTQLPNCGHKCVKLCHSNKIHFAIKCKFPCERLCDFGHKCPALCFQQPCPPCSLDVEKTLFPCGHKHNMKCSVSPDTIQCLIPVKKTIKYCKHEVIVPCEEHPKICPEECGTRLDCGHKCPLKCHVKKDPYHTNYECKKACGKLAPNCDHKHKCLYKCYEECGPCLSIVEHKMECGHKFNVPCAFPKQYCSENCLRTLSCGHKCPKLCGEECGECPIEVQKTYPSCGHQARVPCSVLPDSTHCKGACIKMMECGHACLNKCNEPCSNPLSCKETSLIEPTCPRNHPVKSPCNLNHANSLRSVSTALTGATIGDYCTKICGATLDCGHDCKASCKYCLNGRFHAPCQEPCKKVLVCGHVCNRNCSMFCPPCQQPCMWSCEHSTCRKQCGVLCTPCQEPCTRRCTHSKCTAKCGEKCNREPCSNPCRKLLKCFHPCVGFCGEPCPPLCRICNRAELTKTFFGTEDDLDSRFVVLKDCQHVFEASGLEYWLKSRTERSGSAESTIIAMKKCPLCTKTIYNTARYKNEILENYELVSIVKRRYFPPTVMVTRDYVFAQAIENPISSEEFKKLKRRIGSDFREKQMSEMEISLLKFQVEFLINADKIKTRMNGETSRLDRLIKRIMRLSIRVSPQFMIEASCELRRLDVSISVEKIRQYSSRNEVHWILIRIDEAMKPNLRFDQNLELLVIPLLKEAERYTTSLALTNQERLQVLGAMGFSKEGHWYACPNGHIYCIADCGGAMVESTCPECPAKIGGSSHKLLSNNRVATEMDGATTSAWPGCSN